MTTRYWVAKYVEDPLRNEPRNIGVIVSTTSGLAARFAGENEDGVLDKRRLQRFKYAGVYIQWLDYWRAQIQEGQFERIVPDRTPNYYIVDGGSVADTGVDSAATVCNFLFSLLVSDEPVMQAFELAERVATEQELPSEVSKAFAELELLADTPTLHVRNPIKRNAPIRGRHTVHKPSFSQTKGHQYVYETIDFNGRAKFVRERSGWMAYMFSDIRDSNPNTQAFSIIRSAEDDGGEAIEYASAILSDFNIVDWRDDIQRKRFLNDRQRVAESIGQ